MDRGRESVSLSVSLSVSSPSLRTGQALFTHPALRLMGSNSETEVFEFYDSLWRYRPACRAAVRLNSPASSKKRLRHRWWSFPLALPLFPMDLIYQREPFSSSNPFFKGPQH